MKKLCFVFILLSTFACNEKAETKDVFSYKDYDRLAWEATKSCEKMETSDLEYNKITEPYKIYSDLESNNSATAKLGLAFYYMKEKKYSLSLKKYNEAVLIVNNAKGDHFDIGLKYTEKSGTLRLIDKKTSLKVIKACIDLIKSKNK